MKKELDLIIKQQKEIENLNRGIMSLVIMVMDRDEEYCFAQVGNDNFHALFQSIRYLIKDYKRKFWWEKCYLFIRRKIRRILPKEYIYKN